MFVIRVYAQAIDMMYIDQDSLAKSVCWLMQQQRGDGSFIEPGHCSHLSVTDDDVVDVVVVFLFLPLMSL